MFSHKIKRLLKSNQAKPLTYVDLIFYIEIILSCAQICISLISKKISCCFRCTFIFIAIAILFLIAKIIRLCYK